MHAIYTRKQYETGGALLLSKFDTREAAEKRLAQEADNYAKQGFDVTWMGGISQFSAINLDSPNPIHRFLWIAPC